MHDYSIDTDIRRLIHVKLAIISLGLPAWILSAAPRIGIPMPLAFPISSGTLFALMFWAWNMWIWRWGWVRRFHGIPDLNGKWQGKGKSSYIDPARPGEPFAFDIEVTIKQTFSRMEIDTKTSNSTSRSFMSSFELDHTVSTFRYAYDNKPGNMANSELQRHPGMMDIRVESEGLMRGDYFSGKHRLRYGEITLTRNNT